MKLVRWMRFTWELNLLPPLQTSLPEHYHVRAAERGEEKVVSHLILNAFSQDSAWSDAFKDFRGPLQSQIESTFARNEVPALVICHGQRIIGASAMSAREDSETNLLSGPCVLMEYRNRGLGTALLFHSLHQLKTQGMLRAHGITKDNVVACKFIYPKFSSTNQECEFEPALAGT